MGEMSCDDGVMLSWRDVGQGTAVVLIHGWMVDGHVYDHLIQALDGSGLRLIVPDLRGAGASGKPDGGYTLERYAADVVGLVEHLGLDSPVIVGHSMGGQVAQLVAAGLGDRARGLMLLCSVPASGMALPDEAHGLFFNSADNREMQGTILDLACKQLAPEDRDSLLDAAGAIPAACIQGAYEAWTGGGFADRLGSITAPTLVVATSDPFLPPAFLDEAVVQPIPTARMAVLQGPGHYPQVEQPGPIAALVSAFVAGLGA